MKKAFVFSCTLLALAAQGFSQEYLAEYNKLIEDQTWDEVPGLLNRWVADEPNNVEARMLSYNYYFEKSKGRPPASKKEPVKTSKTNAPIRKTAPIVNDSLFHIALSHLHSAIEVDPRRLDPHLALAYSWREKGDVASHLDVVLKLIDLNHKIKSKWLWVKGEPVKDAEEFFKATIQAYNHELFNMPEPQIDAIEAISEKMIRYYPEDAENYSNLGACKMSRGMPAEAMSYYAEAYEKAPDDMVVVGNMAIAYKELGQNEEAIRFYEIMQQKGNYKQMEYAKSQIAELKK